MRRKLAMVAGAAALVVAACAPAASPAPGGGGGGDIAGTTVTVGGAFVDVEAAAFEEAVKPFEDATGVDVIYSGDKSFEQQLNVQVQAGNPPDVALLPQPGLMRSFAAQGELFPLPDDIVASIDANYGPGWKDVGTADDGKVYGVFHRVNLKGLVFYPKAVFEARGYTPPATWDELKALMDKMVADGTPPWCIGIESGAATGWPITDWVEQIMLRTVGAEGYDKWVSGETPFTDASVKNAFEILMDIWGDEQYVFGGANYVVQTNFGEAPKAAFDDPPKCLLTNQGNFITAFFPEAVQADLDNQVGVFNLPEIDSAIGTPAVVGGDQAVAFADRPEIWAFLRYLTTPEAGVSWAKAGGALFPYKGQDLANYSSELDRVFAETLVNASFVRFDGSDAMPAEVGSGTFWSEPVKLLTGSQDLDTTLRNIAASWPQ
ncbi:MAG TPA: ABC transporter substrate-binding protein [Patescibacteria group bacterium]|nr:ABC transporter substrate-binding protein [Patescibacteria group bacterium]